jgi:uncharacterized protein (TIGR02117 family)
MPEPSNVEPDPAPRRRSLPRRLLRLVLRVVVVCALAVGLYCGAAEIGMRLSVNGDADPLAGTVDVYLVSNGVHVDVWVPAQHAARDWTTWFPPELPVVASGYVAFGWGNREFFLEVPTWDDLTLGLALRAVFLPSATAMHVSAFYGAPYEDDDVHLLRLTPERYADLVAFLDGGFELDDRGRPNLIEHAGYAQNDRFFIGRGSYSLFRTCNVWTNDAVKAMGKRAGRWTPFERHVRHHLPRNRGRAGEH